MTSPAAILKLETTQAHQRTEKALVGRIRDITGARDYCSLLACLYGYFSPLEETLGTGLAPLFTDYPLRRKSDRLLEDIRTLNTDFPLRLSDPLAADPALSTLTAGTALGYAYVMEGSVLGGAVIKKMISGRFPEIPGTAFSFFGGYGEKNREMWNAFLDVLNGQLASAEAMDDGLRAANACFTGMESWIDAWYGGTSGQTRTGGQAAGR